MRHGTILDLRAANGPSNINIEKRVRILTSNNVLNI